ncbi:MAG: SPASM domain-containing protein [Gallionella sp.]
MIERLVMIHRLKVERQFLIKVILSQAAMGLPTISRSWHGLKRVSRCLKYAGCLWRLDLTGSCGRCRSPVECTRWLDVSITTTGVVAHCCMDEKTEFPIGNVNHEHVLEIFNKPDFRRLREKLSTRMGANSCHRCGFL